MSRGRGVTLQRYSTGALSDAKVFNRAEGLSWTSGERIRTEQNIEDWVGSRAQAGRKVPRGFPANNRFAWPYLPKIACGRLVAKPGTNQRKITARSRSEEAPSELPSLMHISYA